MMERTDRATWKSPEQREKVVDWMSLASRLDMTTRGEAGESRRQRQRELRQKRRGPGELIAENCSVMWRNEKGVWSPGAGDTLGWGRARMPAWTLKLSTGTCNTEGVWRPVCTWVL